MDKYCVFEEYTIMEVIEKIDMSHDRVAIVVNKDMKIIGVVSQGDIIRALISGKSLYSKISGIVQSGFLYLTEHDMNKAYKIFKEKKITLLPIIDSNFKLKNVITLSEIYDYVEKINLDT